MALGKQGKLLIDEAIDNLNLMVNFGINPAKGHLLLGALYQEQNALEPALNHYQQALAAAPNDADILNRIGVVLQSQHKSRLAVHFHQRALTSQPNHIDAMISLAYLDLGQINDALQYIHQALAAQPNHPVARYNHAINAIDAWQLERRLS